MTWHLKDRELENKLIERFPSFVYELGKHCESSGNFNFSVKLCRKGFCYYTDEMTFSKDELEEIHEYNPHAWNDSRKVTPPEDVVFRVKVHRARKDDGETVLYECLIFRRSVWYRVINGKPLGIQFSLYEGDYVEFKSWED